MKNIRNKFLTSLLSVFVLSNTVWAADLNDSFLNDFNTIKETFSEGAPRKTTIKKPPKKDKKSDKKEAEKDPSVTNLDIKSDVLDYYPERQEVEAVGHASITVPEDGSTLRADKLILNQETGILTGYGNVRLIKDSNVMEGDFVKINLNEDNAFLNNAITENIFLKLKAETANLKGRDIILENGLSKIKQDKVVQIGTSSFSQYGQSQLADAKKVFYLKEKYNEEYTIKAKEIYVDARKENDTVTVKHADVYLKNMKIGSAGTINLITNKQQQYVETNAPELGFIRQIGTYAGPGFATTAPFGGALKVIPFVNIFNGSVGVGGAARYRNDKNMTEFAISSVKDADVIVRGEHEFTKDLKLDYSMNGYIDEWFLGDRLPGKAAELVYHKKYEVPDLGMNIEHRLSGGVVEEYGRRWSTARFRWMGEANRPIWYYGDDVNRRYATLELSTQGMMSVYGTGDTLGLLRIGPRLRTETDRWIQTVGYFYTAQHGDSPMWFDKYRYGTNNAYISEGLKLNKYISVMWSGSFSLNQDAFDDKLMQENRFYVMVGPDDIKFTLGYDTVRQRTLFQCFAVLGTKNANVEFKKMYIKNPENLGKSQAEERKEEKSAARMEAKAEMKPSFTQRLFRKYKAPEIEPEVENTIFDTKKPVVDPHEYSVKYEPAPEVIIPKTVPKKNILPAVESINPDRKDTGLFRLRDVMEQKTGVPRNMPMLPTMPSIPLGKDE